MGQGMRSELSSAVWEHDKDAPNTHQHYVRDAFGSFYPLYESRELRSHSPYTLALRRGRIRINPRSPRRVRLYSPLSEFIDTETVRLGGPEMPRGEMGSVSAFAGEIADAMRADVAETERRFPDWTNLVMCGGKDSMNLLLLPWRNPVVVLSGEPNYRLVKEFIRENKLPYECVRLESDSPTPDSSSVRREVLLNFCRVDLAHSRWVGHQSAIAEEHGWRALIWRGQLGDILLTPGGRRYRHLARSATRSGSVPARMLRKAMGVAAAMMPPGRQHRLLMEALWSRAAQWQGAHCGLTHELIGVPGLSAYHGRHVSDVLRRRFVRTVDRDIRPQIGRLLADSDVWYPASNPGPPPSHVKCGLSSLDAFVHAASEEGIRIERP